MITIRKILFPTDFSPNAKLAEKYACALAEQNKSELHALFVAQDAVVVAPDPTSGFAMPASNLDEVVAGAQQALAKVPDSTFPQVARVVRHVRTGSPFVEIVRYAKEHDIDLIVLGTHGRTGLAHVFLGSVAENVVRTAPCPVLTVRPDAHQFVSP